MYAGNPIGPALGSLRRRTDLTRAEVARRLGLSVSAASRIEAERSNPHAQNLLRYLDAIGASLTDLDVELSRADEPDALELERRRNRERLATDPAYRAKYREVLEEFGAGDDPLIARLDEFDQRLKSLESERGQ